ncbi:RNA 2'-phosphotransferase [Acinetobacter wuhouensis]|uniref:Probable RNA 2'-phosphotransferase n=1 Tax=Acinetobacter wuhouensis TaxID=1879050 RepID=A0A3G2T206_9GAMM|nr:RNA 2'-phosphotransferase [Acinetobacter wuhouensis]AYO54259.1 RNA 2'-phosphotransferase [Acinetobacter wuhouensis]
MNDKEISKYLSFILRHQPESIQLKLDQQGWANIEELINNAEPVNNFRIDIATLNSIVENSDKKRFQISSDGLKIRAVQGHSTSTVDRTFTEKMPPEILFHGTAERFIDSIKQHGLVPKERQYVHLSENIETAITVGQRYGKPRILSINALEMYHRGIKFYQAENGVWLVERVDSHFIAFEP